MMKKLFSLLLCALALAAFLGGCGSQTANAPEKKDETKKLKIVTTIYPLYDWTKEILGGEVKDTELTLLLRNGVDMHSYQPTAEDIMKLSSCDVLIYVGGESDAWVEDARKAAVNKNMVAVRLMDVLGDRAKREEAVEGMEAHHHHDHDEDDHEHHHEHEDHHDHDHDHAHHHDHDHEHHHDHHHDHDHDHGEVEEYGISSFVYYRRKPMNLNAFDYFVYKSWPKGVIRTKGITYFSENEDMSYLFEQAGTQKTLQEAGQWICTAPINEQEMMLQQSPELRRDWDEKYGDKMVKLVFIGKNMDKKSICEALDKI